MFSTQNSNLEQHTQRSQPEVVLSNMIPSIYYDNTKVVEKVLQLIIFCLHTIGKDELH